MIPDESKNVDISTHAPAQGATSVPSALPQASSISTHAPAQGATVVTAADMSGIIFQPTLPHRERLAARKHGLPKADFNPRSRTGSDPHLPGAEQVQPISTHAPAQGATGGKR